MANSFVVSSLPDYVEQNRPLLRSTSILGARSAQLFTRQGGVKGSAALNILNTSVSFGNGAACGWNEAGTSTLSQRTLVTGQMKVNMAFCEKTLIGKWAEKEVEIIANPKSMPFEQEVMASVVDGIQEALETAIWQGDVTSGSGNNAYFDGINTILAGLVSAGTISGETIAAGTSYIAAVQQVLMAMPAGTLKDDAVIFCSPEFLRGYEQALVAENLYHFVPGQDIDDITIPGSRVKLVAVGGLTGTKHLVAGRLSNFFYGYDIDEAPRTFDLWYSKDAREFRLAVEFNAGVQIAFPDEVVYATYTTLSDSPVHSAQLAAIAAGVDAISDGVEDIAGDTATLASNSTTLASNTTTLANADHVFKTKEQQ